MVISGEPQDGKELAKQPESRGLAETGLAQGALAASIEQAILEEADIWLSEFDGQIYTANEGKSYKPFGAGSNVLLIEAGFHVEQLRTVIVDGEEHAAPYIQRNDRGQEVAFWYHVLAVGINATKQLVVKPFLVSYKLSGYLAERISKYLYEVTEWGTSDKGKKYPKTKKLRTDRGYICSPEDAELTKQKVRDAGGSPTIFDISGGLVAVIDSANGSFPDFYDNVIQLDKFSTSNFETKSRRRVCEQLLGQSCVPVEVKQDERGDMLARFKIKRYRIPQLARTLLEQLGKAVVCADNALAERLIARIGDTIGAPIEDIPPIVSEHMADEVIHDSVVEEESVADDAEFTEETEPLEPIGSFDSTDGGKTYDLGETPDPEVDDLPFEDNPLVDIPEPKYDDTPKDRVLHLYRFYLGYPFDFDLVLNEHIGYEKSSPEGLSQEDFKKHLMGIVKTTANVQKILDATSYDAYPK